MSKDDRIESVEQSQETIERPHRARPADVTKVRQAAEALFAALGDVPDGDIVAEIVDSGLKLLRDRTNRGDMKLINKAIKELRYAMRIFAPYHAVHKVSIFGSARTPEADPDYQTALEFARRMAAAGWMVITGAGGGIMAAGHGGAGAEPSFGLAIRLPFEQETNPHIAQDKKLINFKYFFTRKLMFIRSSHAAALFPGGFGTLDEGFEALTLIQTGKSVPMPVVMVDRPGGTYWEGWLHYVKGQLLDRGFIGEDDLRLFRITDSVDEAVREIAGFYRNYHSVRYVRDDLVIRLQHAPDQKQLDHLRREFADLVSGDDFRVSGPLPMERDETDLLRLPRLVFGFNRRDQGRLRMLIDYLNTF